MEVYLAQPRGFCAGVVRAIEIVERALEKYGPPVYVRHEIVHNKYVVESLKAKGAIFVEDLSEVPPDAVTVFSAHGVAKSVEEEAAGARPAGAQCHLPAGDQGPQSGQALHVEGPQADPDRACRPSRGRGHHGPGSRPGAAGPERRRRGGSDAAADTPVAYITQTTLSVDDTKDIIAALQRRFTIFKAPTSGISAMRHRTANLR
jgi:4-hydroxy-3-methylbut-2-enyl diphosphate reductase